MKNLLSSRARLTENVEYILRDKDGKIKPVFQTWNWVSKLIKTGKLSPNHAKIAGLFGYWAQSLQVSNLITNAGRGGISGRLMGSGAPAAFTYIAVGIGTTAANAADTALESEITDSGMARVAGTLSLVTTSVTNDTAQASTTFTVTGTKAVTESGMLNAASTGTLLCRQVFSAINVVNGDSLQIIWKIQNS